MAEQRVNSDDPDALFYVGDTLYVDFGDSITDHPEVTGEITQVNGPIVTLDHVTSIDIRTALFWEATRN